jgi:oligoendopeptidase F
MPKLRLAWILAALPIAALPQSTGIDAARISPTLYFPSAAAELESRNSLHARVERLAAEIPSAAPDALPALLDTVEQTTIALQRHSAYLRMLTLEDRSDQAARAAGDAVSADRSVLNATLTARLRQVPRDEIPSLGRYARLAELAHEDVQTFSPDAQRYRTSVTLPAMGSIAAAYGQLRMGDEQAPPVAASLLATLIDLQNRDAIAQGYPNAAARKYLSLQLSDALIQKTLAAVEAEAAVHREYQLLTARKSPAPPRMSLDEARRLILDSFHPLGADYTSRFAALLDPANGRLDLTGGNHRARTGTSIAVYDAPVAFFYTGFDGSLASISTVAHEGGHAIHREFMNVGGHPIYQRSGPNYLFEGFAIFNELLLLDHAARTATTPEGKANATEQFLRKLSHELFDSAEETAFERSLYTAAVGHAPLDRAAVDRIYRESIAPYESSLPEAVDSRQWMRKSLLFEDPLYLVNYLYAAVVAVALFDRVQTDHDFAARYQTLLRRGFDADTDALLASMDIRLEDPNLVKAAAARMRAKMADLHQ